MRKSKRTLLPAVSLVALLLAVASAWAIPLRGSIVLPEHFARRGGFDTPGYWRFPNEVLRVLPPLRDPRGAMIVALEGTGLSTSANVEPLLTIADSRFSPPVLAVRPKTTVKLKNDESVLHLLEIDGEQAAKRIGPGETTQHRFDKAGSYLVRCSEVPHLMATVVVLDEPQFVIADDKGGFRFPDLPAGTYTLKVWYAGKWIHSQPVTVQATRTTVEVKLPR